MEWFRWYVGSSLDPKFRVVAQRSAQTLASVLAVWVMLLERASAEADRGSFAGFDCESVDAALELAPGATAAILAQMEHRGLLADGHIANWRKRQPLREDPTAAFRKQAQRLREKERYTVSRAVTTEEKRREKKKTEETEAEEKYRENAFPKSRAVVVSEAGQMNATKEDVVSEAGQMNATKEDVVSEGRPVSGESSGLSAAREDVVSETGLALRGQVPGKVAGLVRVAGGKEPETMPVVVEWSADQDFMVLRKVYSRVARREESYKGYAEYCQLQESQDWPGLEPLCRAVADFAEKDRKWQQGYAPGLPRFLREKWWQRQPEPRAPLTYAQAQDAERRQRAMRLLEHHSDV